MAERSLNLNLKKRLINNEPFAYAHLIKYERPSATSVSGKHSTDAKRYAYLTDATVNIVFDDGSYATDGSANGNQTYIADKIYKVGSYSETSQAKATGMQLDLGAESLNNSVTASMTMTTTTIVASSVDFVTEGFREGDKISITDGTNDGHEVKIIGIKTNNTVLKVSNIDSTLATQSSAASTTLKIISDELKGPLLEMNDATLKSYHNRDVFIYKAFLDPDDYSIIGAPNLIFKGIISSASLQEDPSKSMRVSWKLTSHWGDFSVVNGRWTNDAVHRALDNEGNPQEELTLKEVYAKDLGFQHAETTMHILATYKTIEQEQRFKKKKNLFGLLPSSYKPYTVDVEVEHDVDLNWALSSKYIPVVYGVDRLTGIPIFVDTKSNDSNNVFIVYALAEGEIGGIYDLYVENEPLICSNLEDYDDRNNSGYETDGSTVNSADNIDVVCRGRADKGDTLGGENLTGSNSSVTWPIEGLAGTLVGFIKAAELDVNSINFYEIDGLDTDAWDDLDLDNDTKSTDGSGVLDGKTIFIDKPNNMRFTIHSGKTNQDADDTLVTIAEGVKFKRQDDYFGDAGQTYWGPNHTLSDTAYVVVDCEIAEDATEVPEVEYVIRGKYVDSLNYDFSYLHDPTVTITGAEAATHFSVGDTIGLKNSTGDAYLTKADDSNQDDLVIIDKWTIYGPDGLETRFRFSEAPRLTYSNGVPAITSFYMVNSASKTWHMVTYNHGQNSGTIVAALSASGTTTTTGQVPVITFASDPGWVDIFPSYQRATNQLPIAFTESTRTYKNTSFPVTHSVGGTVLTMTGATNATGFIETGSYGEPIIRTDAIKLVSGNANDDYYNGMTVTLTIEHRTTGDTTEHTRKIVDYDGGTGTAQVDVVWDKGKEPYRDNATYLYTYAINTVTDRRVSINPAMQLLDYMTSKTYGKRLDLTKDMSLSDWLFAARTCDSRGTQTLTGTSISATEGDRYILQQTDSSSSTDAVIAMGRVQSTVSSSTTVVMEECFGKFSKTFMKNHHTYIEGDIIQTSTGYYKVGSSAAGTISTKPTHASGTTNGLTFLANVTLRKLGTLGTTITLTNVSSGVYSDYTNYSIYNSDFVKMWRYLGWEDHHQRWVTRHQLCGTLDTATSVFDNINGFLKQFNGLLSYESGLYVLKIETTSTAITSDIADSNDTGYTVGSEMNVRYITNEDIIGSIKVTDPGPKKAYNTMTSTIADPGSRFKGKAVSFYDSNFLKTDKMVIKSGTHTQPAVSSYYNARVNVENALRKSRFGMRITFQLGPKALLLLAGETIAITYAKFGWSAKKFRISNISFNTDCTANITATEYDDSFYTISTPVLASLANDDVRASVQAVLGTPNGLAADAVTMGNIDLTWINGSNVAPANTTEVWVASSNDRTKAQLLTDVHCVSSIKQRVNGAVTGSASVTLDSGNGVLIGQKVTGPNISTTVTVAAISGTSLTLSSVQTLANNAYLTFDNTASYQHSIGEDAQAKYYWIRHKKLTNKNIPRFSGWHPTSATAGVTATSTIPEVFYAVTVSSDAQTFTANSSGVIQSPDTVKFTATKNNLTSAFVWSTDPSVSLYAAATGGSPVTSGSVVYLRKGDFSGDTVSVTATVDATDAEELAGADANYSEIVAVPKIASGGGAGNDAKSVRLRSSSYVFKEAEDDVSSAPGSPDYIQFDAVKQNTTATASWATSPSVTLYDASTGGSVATTGNTIYMRKADYGTNTSVTVTLTCDSIVDKANIVRLVENSGTVQAVLSNVAHVLPADYLGAVTDAQAVGSGTNIRVYEGVQALAFVTGTPGAGEWALSVGNTANIVEGGVTDNGTYATIASHTSVTTGTDTYKITYTISGKTRKAEAFTNFTVDQYLTKAKGGADGVIGYSVRLEAEDYSVLYNAAGGSPAFTDANSDGDIALTTTEVGFTTPYYRFKIATADWTSWSTTSTSTFDVPSSVFTPAKVMKVEVREGNSGDAAASDSISIYPIQPGSDGSDGSVFVELQIQYQGTAAQYATPSTPTGGSYNFATSAFTPPTNWTLAMPEGENYKPVWVSVATASAAAGGTDSSITWTSAQLLDQGNQIIDIYYNKSATIPTPPTTTFGSTPVGWSTTVPSGSDTLWQAIGYGDLSEGNYYRYVWGPVTQVTFTAYTVICTNEAHTYSSDITGGGVLTTNSGTSFEVFRGSTQLTGILTGTPTVDQFKVTATGTNITPSSTYGGSVASKVVVFADHTAGTIMSGVGNLAASISYSIAISTGVQAKTVTKKQTFVKTLKPKAPVGNFAYITSGEIERNGAGTYSATYLDIDFTFNEEGAAVSRDRFRIARSSDTWSGTLGTPGAHASGDLATGLLATAVTVSGKAAVLKVTYTDSAGVTANVSAPVKISHDGVGSYVAYLYKLNDTSLTSTSAGTFAAPLTGNTDWSLTVPSLTADGDKVYVSSRFFTQDGASPQDSAWATPTIHSQRTDGTAAVNSRYPTLYRLNSNTVADVDGGTFANPRTGNTDWNYAVPTMTANGHIVYAISRIFTSDAASPQEDEWSTPAIYATRVDGQTVTGPAGQGVRQANLYKLNDTTLTSSSAGTFADPQTGNTDWDFDVPAVASDGDKVYVATRTFTSNAASPQDSAWSTPSIYAHRTDGTDGSTGASVNIVFARAASVPSTPTASSGVPSQDIQWYDSAPSGTDVLWASRGEKGVGATNFTWTTPFQIEGEAHAEVAIYRKTTVSETPSGGSYNFATSTLTAPTNWSQTVPTLSSNGDKVWLSVGLFSGASTATAATTTWTASVLYAQRTDGSDAVNSRYPTLYRLNSNTVADTDGGSFADPRTGNTDWNYAVPTMTANGHIVYAISRIFTSDGNSPQESAWSTPAIYAQRVDGSTITGPAGQGSRFVSLYNKNDSSLGSTTAGSFATPLHADNSNDGWQYAVPALSANLDKIYVTTRLFTSDGASPQDSNWVTPVIYAERVDGQGVNYAKLYSLNDASIGNTTAGTFANPASGQEAGWTLVPPDIGTVDGNKIYISTRTFTSDGESPQTAAWLTPTVYQIYTVGDPGFRTIQGYLFYEKTTANAPAAPSGNTYTFSTGLVTGTGITNNAANDTWNNVPNTQDATSSNTFYMVRYYGTEAAAESSTINVLYSAVIEQTSFTGIVTFSSGSFVTGGSNITTIDGGNITTGSVDADKVAAGSFTVTGGGVGGWTINSTSIYTGTEDHSGYTANAGDMTIYSNETDSSIHAKNFYIDTAGNLTATNVTLTGTITASDGAIGGWEVDSDKIYSSSNLASNAVEAVIIDKTQNYILIRDDSS